MFADLSWKQLTYCTVVIYVPVAEMLSLKSWKTTDFLCNLSAQWWTVRIKYRWDPEITYFFFLKYLLCDITGASWSVWLQ